MEAGTEPKNGASHWADHQIRCRPPHPMEPVSHASLDLNFRNVEWTELATLRICAPLLIRRKVTSPQGSHHVPNDGACQGEASKCKPYHDTLRNKGAPVFSPLPQPLSNFHLLFDLEGKPVGAPPSGRVRSAWSCPAGVPIPAVPAAARAAISMRRAFSARERRPNTVPGSHFKSFYSPGMALLLKTFTILCARFSPGGPRVGPVGGSRVRGIRRDPTGSHLCPPQDPPIK